MLCLVNKNSAKKIVIKIRKIINHSSFTFSCSNYFVFNSFFTFLKVIL